MSSIDKKTLAGLLLGIGALALAAKKGNQGSRGFFPAPTGKAPKGQGDTFTEEQDDIFFSFKQNAPTKSISTKFGPDLDARRQKKRQISQMQDQKSAKQQSLRQLQDSISTGNFGDVTAVAQMQNEVNSIQAQIDNANNIVSTMNINLSMDSDDPAEIAQWQAAKEAAEQQLENAEQRLLAVKEILPQSQKTRMQGQATSISAQIANLNDQINTAKAQLATLQDKIRADSTTGDDYTFAEYFDEFSERGYTSEAATRYESAEANKAWEDWEKQMEQYRGWGEVAPKFTADAEDNSGAMSGTGFKTGTKLPDVQKKFSGTSSSTNPFAPTFALPKIK